MVVLVFLELFLVLLSRWHCHPETRPGLSKASGLFWMRRKVASQFSKKISLLHSHVLFLLCVELNLVFVIEFCASRYYFCCD